jgi:hypothetical protein
VLTGVIGLGSSFLQDENTNDVAKAPISNDFNFILFRLNINNKFFDKKQIF